MKKTDCPSKDRRAALLRLGFGALAVYTAPALTTLSQAQASTGSGGGSGGSGGGSGGSGGSSVGSSSSAASDTRDGDAATISARDHRRAQKAVREGRAMPLIDVLEQVRGSLRGNLISVRYRETRTTNKYVLKVVTDDGRLTEVNVDARTANILGESR